MFLAKGKSKQKNPGVFVELLADTAGVQGVYLVNLWGMSPVLLHGPVSQGISSTMTGVWCAVPLCHLIVIGKEWDGVSGRKAPVVKGWLLTPW